MSKARVCMKWKSRKMARGEHFEDVCGPFAVYPSIGGAWGVSIFGAGWTIFRSKRLAKGACARLVASAFRMTKGSHGNT